jgi:hypothetical protein
VLAEGAHHLATGIGLARLGVTIRQRHRHIWTLPAGKGFVERECRRSGAVNLTDFAGEFRVLSRGRLPVFNGLGSGVMSQNSPLALKLTMPLEDRTSFGFDPPFLRPGVDGLAGEI